MNCGKGLEGFNSCDVACKNRVICKIMSDNLKDVLSAKQDKGTKEVISLTDDEVDYDAVAQL